MAKPLDPFIVDVLKKFGFGKDAIWDCHGTLVVYHRILEQIAAKAGIKFDPPFVLEANGAAKSVALCVTGNMADRSEWSVGEASPANCKNSYPYAMAEKRAKDRVILKLIGLHGLVYSEEEADDFKSQESAAKQPEHGEAQGPLTKTALKEKLRQFCADLPCCETEEEFSGLMRGYQAVLDQCERDLSGWWNTKPDGDSKGIKDRIAERRAYIAKRSQNPLHAA